MVGRSKESGYVALLAVLIMGAATLATSLALLTNGMDNQRSTLAEQQSVQARQLAAACAEEALQVIRDSSSYVGTAGITLTDGMCNYTVTNTGGSARIIDAMATVNNLVRKLKVYVTITSSGISITSWQEVADA